ncbi:MAG TPA: hypothetical protein PKC49_08565 [Phycisphaerae bacterium]|nr:hypothetical protein [Phycisphaerae bacterium]
MRTRLLFRPGLGAAMALSLAASAHAGSIDIGGGWRAAWDASLDGYVQIISNGVVGDAVFIQKSAEFTQGPDQFGFFPAIPITFTQIEANAVHNIVIQDEIITNSTGHDWTDFHFDIIDAGDAWFDPVAPANSGGAPPIGWTIDPFTQAAFSPDLMRLDVWDGVVPNGTQWYPGDGLSNGDLWISVVPHAEAPFTVFTLKETPTPEPTTLLTLAMGGLLLRRRR